MRAFFGFLTLLGFREGWGGGEWHLGDTLPEVLPLCAPGGPGEGGGLVIYS